MRRRREESLKANDDNVHISDDANNDSGNSEEDANLLDQDEQDRLIADIEHKIIKQQVSSSYSILPCRLIYFKRCALWLAHEHIVLTNMSRPS
jgi:hypothetical protein